jgi:hypothetical protein
MKLFGNRSRRRRLRDRIRTFLITMQLGSIDLGASSWEQLAKPA